MAGPIPKTIPDVITIEIVCCLLYTHQHGNNHPMFSYVRVRMSQLSSNNLTQTTYEYIQTYYIRRH